MTGKASGNPRRKFRLSDLHCTALHLPYMCSVDGTTPKRVKSLSAGYNEICGGGIGLAQHGVSFERIPNYGPAFVSPASYEGNLLHFYN